MSVRWVAVDDRDLAINYSSGWAQPNGADWNNQGNFGQTFMNTLHTVTGGSASFSYTFNGKPLIPSTILFAVLTLFLRLGW
jgi:hypothetical protein